VTVTNLAVAEPLSHRTINRSQQTDLVSGATVKRQQSNRIPIAILFAVLWSGGMVLRAPSLNLQTVLTAIIAGAIVGGLVFWLFDKLRPPS
jgi:hypothetical protein